MFVRAYLRASTSEQDASRARSALEQFASERGMDIASWYVENESGASLARPELFRLLTDCHAGDVLLVEQVDRLSRLNEPDWELLKKEINRRQVKIVALDLPTSWQNITYADETTSRILSAVNSMLLDMLAAIARKDYADRRRRQSEGIQKAKQVGAYKGRKEDTERNNAIISMLRNGIPWTQIQQATGCSRSTLSRLRKRI